jgi:hypothetical protein
MNFDRADSDTDEDEISWGRQHLPPQPPYTSLLRQINEVYNTSLTEESPQVPTPPGIKVPLRPHQAAIVARMVELERSLREGYAVTPEETFFSRFALLGDVVGAGKSLCILAFLAHIKAAGPPSIANPPHYHAASTAMTFSLINVPMHSAYRGANLLIVPHTLYRQWMDYCTAQSNLNVFFCKTRRNLADPVAVKKAISESDLTLVSNTLYADLQEASEGAGIRWERCFIDEVDTIHLPTTRPPIMASFTWFITATWLPVLRPSVYIFNHIIDSYNRMYNRTLHDDFRGIVAECLQKNTHITGSWASARFFKAYISNHPCRTHTIIRTANAFRAQSMESPPIYYNTIRCSAPRHARMVSTMLGQDIQMALHADDMETVFRQLGVNTTTEANLLKAVTDMQRKELVRLEQTLQFKAGLEYATPQAKEEAVRSLKEKIATVEGQIAGLGARIRENKMCYICYDDISGREMVVPCCHNVFCAKCILTSITYRPTCPFCRETIRPAELTYIGTQASGTQVTAPPAKPELLPKARQLLQLLLDNPTSRVIVFSRYDNPFHSIQGEIERHNIRVAIINGNKDHIYNLQEQFKAGTIRVLLLNSQHFCAGMNLEAASHVVLYHAGMSYTEEEQIIGRAYRMGRREPLNVVRLIYDGEAA